MEENYFFSRKNWMKITFFGMRLFFRKLSNFFLLENCMKKENYYYYVYENLLQDSVSYFSAKNLLGRGNVL